LVFERLDGVIHQVGPHKKDDTLTAPEGHGDEGLVMSAVVQRVETSRQVGDRVIDWRTPGCVGRAESCEVTAAGAVATAACTARKGDPATADITHENAAGRHSFVAVQASEKDLFILV
jgi:hypothetical protein